MGPVLLSLPIPTTETRPLRACLLGSTEIAIGGDVIPPRAWQGRAGRQLLLLLLGTPGHRLPRDQILDTLWPDSDPAAALNALYKALHAVRRVLEPGLRSAKESAYVAVGGDAVALAPGVGAWVDADAFAAAIGGAGALPEIERRVALRDALALRSIRPHASPPMSPARRRPAPLGSWTGRR